MKLYHQMMIQQELFEYVLFKQSFVELDSDVHSDDFRYIKNNEKYYINALLKCCRKIYLVGHQITNVELK